MDIECSKTELVLLKKIAASAQEMKTPCYLIGGFVRDKLLKRPVQDLDIVCVGDGIELAYLFSTKFNPAPALAHFKNFGTAQIKLNAIHLNEDPHDSTGYEIEFVGARKESYSDHSRKPEVYPGSFQDDQLRRDFTINAMAISLNETDFGSLLDPFDGKEDLKQRILKTPLDPGITFTDDPLRMLRAIRFATQLNFDIDQETFLAIQKNAERIHIVSTERITGELNKIILADKPSIGFHLLSESGLLDIIFPQMMRLHGAEYVDGKGHKDNFYHTLLVLDNVAEKTNDLWMRWAAILHDIAKPVTKRFDHQSGWTFHGHEVVGAKMVPKIFKQLKLPLNEKMRFVQKMVLLHLRPISLTKENITDSAVRRLLLDAGEDIDQLMILCNADITSKNKIKKARFMENFKMVRKRMQEVEEKDHLRNWQPPVSGEEIMQAFGLKPCREVGIIKDSIREAILDGKIENNHSAAFSFMLQKAKDLNLQPVD
ncbi:MAG: HD domain-containing protein [Bacteroidetes bacterium]|nr:HD domain-containing protein [Bacteroidota bacterium]